MRLGQYAVHLTDSTGTLCSFLPGEDVPAWAAEQLGPHCFAADDPQEQPDADVEGGGPAGAGPPPRSGKGSGESAWRHWAQHHGLDVTDVEGRDEIIAACEAAGVPVD